MPDYFGKEMVVANALQGLFGGIDRRRQEEEARQERERLIARQTAADAQAASAAKIGMALQRAALRREGVMEGAAPDAPTYQLPSLAMDGSTVGVQDKGRYSTLGDGFYVDRNATPEFQAQQAERQKATTAANLMEARQRAIGMALQDPDPSRAVQRLLAAGMSPAEAKTTLEGARGPEAKAPVMGTPEYLKAKRAEYELQDEYARRKEGRDAARTAAGQPPAAAMKLPTAAQGRLEAIEGTKRALSEYRKMLDQYGTAMMSGDDPKRNQLDAAFGGVKMVLKEALNLGVINGPDLKILEEQLSPPTGVKASLWKGKKALLAQVDQVTKSMDDRAQTIYQVYGGTSSTPADSPNATQVQPRRPGETAAQYLARTGGR